MEAINIMDKDNWQQEYVEHVDAFNEFRFSCQNLENYELIKSLLGDVVEYLYKIGNKNGYIPKEVKEDD